MNWQYINYICFKFFDHSHLTSCSLRVIKQSVSNSKAYESYLHSSRLKSAAGVECVGVQPHYHHALFNFHGIISWFHILCGVLWLLRQNSVLSEKQTKMETQTQRRAETTERTGNSLRRRFTVDYKCCPPVTVLISPHTESRSTMASPTATQC